MSEMSEIQKSYDVAYLHRHRKRGKVFSFSTKPTLFIQEYQNKIKLSIACGRNL